MTNAEVVARIREIAHDMPPDAWRQLLRLADQIEVDDADSRMAGWLRRTCGRWFRWALPHLILLIVVAAVEGFPSSGRGGTARRPPAAPYPPRPDPLAGEAGPCVQARQRLGGHSWVWTPTCSAAAREERRSTRGRRP